MGLNELKRPLNSQDFSHHMPGENNHYGYREPSMEIPENSHLMQRPQGPLDHAGVTHNYAGA